MHPEQRKGEVSILMRGKGKWAHPAPGSYSFDEEKAGFFWIDFYLGFAPACFASRRHIVSELDKKWNRKTFKISFSPTSLGLITLSLWQQGWQYLTWLACTTQHEAKTQTVENPKYDSIWYVWPHILKPVNVFSSWFKYLAHGIKFMMIYVDTYLHQIWIPLYPQHKLLVLHNGEAQL